LRRRDFIYLSGLGAGSAMIANTAFGKSIYEEQLLTTIDTRAKKELADVALNTAKAKGASYALAVI
jgi:TldD protein